MFFDGQLIWHQNLTRHLFLIGYSHPNFMNYDHWQTRLLHSTANQVALMSPAEVELPGSQINHSLPQKGMSSKSNRCKRWSQEHRLFLLGLEKHGRGDWKAISRIVETRTPTQVATHAQKYFLGQASGNKGKRRSINDIVLPDNGLAPHHIDQHHVVPFPNLTLHELYHILVPCWNHQNWVLWPMQQIYQK